MARRREVFTKRREDYRGVVRTLLRGREEHTGSREKAVGTADIEVSVA